ncbi:phosphopantetheine-binding protein [Streptomyces sp. NPDC006544]|uniref:phosphopantetheine-binding protein n=1 Tax=Streptomyces sp. NPDC006544 TaxID=3154583 RepID=UPI0033BC8D13
MSERLTVEELAALMKSGAGITVDPAEMTRRPDSKFDDFGLDSLGLLGIVGLLENQRGRALPTDADRCKTPKEFLELVNASLMTGA